MKKTEPRKPPPGADMQNRRELEPMNLQTSDSFKGGTERGDQREVDANPGVRRRNESKPPSLRYSQPSSRWKEERRRTVIISSEAHRGT